MDEAGHNQLTRMSWTLGAMVLAIVPHASHLPVWVLVFALALCTWRLAAAKYRWRMPPAWLRILIALLGFSGVLLTYFTINGLDAGSALLIIMMATKLTETAKRRDQTVLLMASYFLVLTSFLYSQRIWNLLYFVIAIWGITAALWQVGRSTQPAPTRRAVRESARVLLHALPVMALLFLLFPRVPGPFWALPSGGGGITGLDDEMTPGSISELSLSDAVAFRVKFLDALPPPQERYWRGPVLHAFDGSTWRSSDPLENHSPPEISGQGTRYRVTLEPHRRNWLYALDVPGTWQKDRIKMSWDYQLINWSPVHQLISYDVTSYTDYRLKERHAYAIDTRLSGDRNPRSRTLAQTLRSQASSDEEFIQRVLSMFRVQEFFYTLQPGKLDFDSVDDFLFNSRKGFCEHFASAFTTLMRAAGIPARVVTGYQGGEYNQLGNYFIVRQSDAHAWSEVWLGERGWVRVDPTAAVAPERIQQGLALALPDEALVAGRFMRSNAFFKRLRMTWDAANNLWNQWIINFDAQTQRALLSWMGLERPQWRTMLVVLVIGMAIFLGFLSLHISWQLRPRGRDRTASLYQRFCDKLARINLTRNASEAPLVFARRVVTARPELRELVTLITALYLRLRYEPDPRDEDLQRLADLVRNFRPSRARSG